ncbi:PDDEXK family nuclease [Staphylococcus auricularis]|uniref:hypothetical protein n=1 Tax=Staphylococcus auricularis TaxID=29379 RepID=UPI00193382B2|nr:hypothetical protein [Staphylococcus auricularis]MBM0867006.1 hypothetical protein [Staphylococcus auricularis]
MPSNEIRSVTYTNEILQNASIEDSDSPSQFIRKTWNYYKSNYPNNNSLNGSIFENLIILSLAREGIENIYYQTELSFVPSAIFDIFLYNKNEPVALSIKTTLRERWKQADLEALAVKQVHKNSKCYVLTTSESEVRARRKNDKSYNGLDGFILVHTSEYDNFVKKIKDQEFIIAGDVPIIKTDNKLYNKEELQTNFDIKL